MYWGLDHQWAPVPSLRFFLTPERAGLNLYPYIRFGRAEMPDDYFVSRRRKAAGAGGRAAIRSLGIQGTWYLETENPPVMLQIHGRIALPYILRAATVQQLGKYGRQNLGQCTGFRLVRSFLRLGCLAWLGRSINA